MLYFSHLLKQNYSQDFDNLSGALNECDCEFALIEGAKDIWLRDFMPICCKSGKFVSFAYKPSYLRDFQHLQTNFQKDIAMQLKSTTYSQINLDGGNVVLSPSKEMALISDRVFDENKNRERNAIEREIEKLLEAQVIIIPSLKSDFTGHADGMVRFVNETTIITNKTKFKKGLEYRITNTLKAHGLEVLDFPYFDANGISAHGCYLNFLETPDFIFLPIFNDKRDTDAICAAKEIFTNKAIISVAIPHIAQDGGCLNCISWED